MRRVLPALVSLIGVMAPLRSFAQNQPLALSRFLAEVQKQSPDLAVEKANVESAQARAQGIRLNPPMIGLMAMKDAEGSRRGVEITQDLPFPSKVYQDRKFRRSELEAQRRSSKYQELSILADARIAYVSFWSAYQRLEIAKEKQGWLKHHLPMARAAARSDNAAQVHLLEMESEGDLADSDVLSVEADLIEKKSALKVFAPGLELDQMIPSEPSLPNLDFKSPEQSSLIQWKQAEADLKLTMLNYKKQSYFPDLFLRFRNYEQTEMAPQSQELMVGITVPFLYFWQPHADVSEASAQQMKAQSELQKARIEVDSKLKSLARKAEAVKTQLAILREKLIPRAQRQLKIVSNQSQRTLEGLDEHKSVMLKLLELRVKSVDLRSEYENIVGESSKLTGNDVEVSAL